MERFSEDKVKAMLDGRQEKKEENAMEFYTVETEAYMGATGYEGNNRRKFDNTSDCFKKALKAAGIDGVSVRKGRGGYTSSFTFTVKPGADDVKTWDDVEAYDPAKGCCNAWIAYSKSDGSHSCIFGEKYYSLQEEEQKDIQEGRKRYMFELIGSGFQAFHSIDEETARYFRPAFLEKVEKLVDVICSFNYDDINSQVDYFDCGFYWQIDVKGCN